MELVAIAHNIRSVHNVGSIFRTADGAGFSKIYLTGITPSPLDRFGKVRKDFAKVALGAEKGIEWEKKISAPGVFEKLKKDGYKIFALEQDKKSEPYFKMKLKSGDKIALLLGDEVRGLPSSFLRKSDKILEIPMRGAMVRQAHHPRNKKAGKESLNVAVAFGIAAYQLAIQKNSG